MGNMHKQPSSFDGFAPPTATDRLFFAVIPDADAVECIVRLTQTLRSEHALHGKPTHADRLHVTLHHLGDFAGLPQDVIAAAGAAAAGVVIPAFDVMFDSASSFAGRARQRPFVLRGTAGVADLKQFQRALSGQMKVAGLPARREDFTPHITLLYDDRIVLAQPVEPVSWGVREFVLVHSLLGKSEHRILGRWPLET